VFDPLYGVRELRFLVLVLPPKPAERAEEWWSGLVVVEWVMVA
jgi:hypothetical protein